MTPSHRTGSDKRTLRRRGYPDDFNLLYEICRLATDPQYGYFHFSNAVCFRNGRPLRDEDRLRVDSLSHKSPLELVTLVWIIGGAAGA